MVDYLPLERKLWTPRLRWVLLGHNLNMVLHSLWRITMCQVTLLSKDTCTSFPWDFGRASFQALPNQTWPCALLLWWVLALYTTKNLENLPKHFNRTEWQKLSQRVSFAIFFLQLENKNINHWQYVLYFCDMAIKLYYVVCIILSDF